MEKVFAGEGLEIGFQNVEKLPPKLQNIDPLLRCYSQLVYNGEVIGLDVLAGSEKK